jgi:hypothetical protein
MTFRNLGAIPANASDASRAPDALKLNSEREADPPPRRVEACNIHSR